MPFLFDTDAISELMRPRPLPEYLVWVHTVQREDQFVSAVTVGELYKGAFRSPARERHLAMIEQRVLTSVTVLPYDVPTARKFGEIRAELEQRGTILADPDLQIAATALYHNLEVVTGNLRHFERISGLRLNRTLADARRRSTGAGKGG
jgi:predicted nucleic acid-binding protein